jgi:hypothetical protein
MNGSPQTTKGFGDDAAMDANLLSGSSLAGGTNQITDPLLENPYIFSLLPASRHPLYQQSPKISDIYFQTLFEMQSHY